MAKARRRGIPSTMNSLISIYQNVTGQDSVNKLYLVFLNCSSPPSHTMLMIGLPTHASIPGCSSHFQETIRYLHITDTDPQVVFSITRSLTLPNPMQMLRCSL